MVLAMSAALPLASSVSVPLWSLDATDLSALVRARKVRAIDAVESAIARIEATHAALNAVVLPCFDDARRRARELDARLDLGEPGGPLAGVPVTVKDQMRVEGLPTTLALPSRKGLIDRDEGPLVSRLRAAGAIVVGKTNVPQLLFGFETDNTMYGRTNNPWDVTPPRTSRRMRRCWATTTVRVATPTQASTPASCPRARTLSGSSTASPNGRSPTSARSTSKATPSRRTT
jgi:Asp-tRNA(Asn)/Glu-tRNA(Gln) amidotransferase A subunit family amidase